MKKNRNEMMVGLFVVIGFVIFSLIVFFISGVYLFRDGYMVSAVYDYVDILDKGAPVRMAGVRVGEVNSVELLRDAETGNTKVKVTLFLEKRAQIRENYEFEIRGTHILSEPHIEITPRPGNAPILQSGAVIEGKKLLPIEDLIKHIEHVAAGLDEIVNGDLKNAQGDTKQAFVQLKKSTDTLNQILEKVDHGEGTAGKLVSSDELYQDVRGLIAEIKAHPWRLLKKDKNYKEPVYTSSLSLNAPSSATPAAQPQKRSKFLGIF